ncbi:hypothetical protein CYLTODRAFT_420093 [Cylindrobasidium torrendii FP15055 ss-10]|uniref:Uncharacterized protein n=1 Tax=Cylindrobasidium torrendii FP15055 ss-10 TaxID=1314674 RepID=A0A0D7BKH6_9AGAR|nr:hypothetical protein CYLTODRAFT_420093 [Cylindrobasidium torrendii FP15055 ss-10]
MLPVELKFLIVDIIVTSTGNDHYGSDQSWREMQRSLSTVALVWPDALSRIREHRFRYILLDKEDRASSFVDLSRRVSSLGAVVRYIQVEYQGRIIQQLGKYPSSFTNVTAIFVDNCWMTSDTLHSLGVLCTTWSLVLQDVRILDHKSLLDGSPPHIPLPLALQHLAISLIPGIAKSSDIAYMNFWTRTLSEARTPTGLANLSVCMDYQYLRDFDDVQDADDPRVGHLRAFSKVVAANSLGVTQLNWTTWSAPPAYEQSSPWGAETRRVWLEGALLPDIQAKFFDGEGREKWGTKLNLVTLSRKV